MKDYFNPVIQEKTGVLQERDTAPLPDRIKIQLEALRRERIASFVKATKTTTPKATSALENQVDALLEAVTDLDRLQQLALLTSRGGQIRVEADRLMIATHAETFVTLVEKYAEQSGTHSLSSALLPSFPLPLEIIE